MVSLQDTRIQRLIDLYNFDDEAYTFYLSEGLQASLALEKAEQASWIKTLIGISRRQAIHMGFKSKHQLYEAACTFLGTQNWRGWKSTSVCYLNKRMKYFRNDPNCYQSLLSGKYGGTNMRRIELSKEQSEALVTCYTNSNPRTFKGAYRRYIGIAQKKIESGEWSEIDKKRGKFKALLSLSAAKIIFKRLEVLLSIQ